MNGILQSENIHDEWSKGDIKRLYKGKGKKGKCANERGITLASNFGKLYERIIDARVRKEVNITSAQLGGVKGASTVDHLYTLKQMEKLSRENNRPLYLTFLDISKAYDKAWNDGIMYALYNNGLKTRIWRTVRRLNQNLKARVLTKYGPTDEFNVNNSIRQGGVLAVSEFAILMDQISKAIIRTNKGVRIPNNDKPIGCLLATAYYGLMTLYY